MVPIRRDGVGMTTTFSLDRLLPWGTAQPSRPSLVDHLHVGSTVNVNACVTTEEARFEPDLAVIVSRYVPADRGVPARVAVPSVCART